MASSAFCTAAMPAAASAATQPAPVWFSPATGGATVQYPDFNALFSTPSQWPNAASTTKVFLVAAQWFRLNSAASVNTLVSWLASQHIALGIESGVLSATSVCGSGVEGFNASDAVDAAKIVKQLGGTISYLAMDEPYYYGHIYTGSKACGWSASLIAQKARQTIQNVKVYFPSVVVGDTEPISSSNSWNGTYLPWATAYRTYAGTPLSFFRGDVDWGDSGWLNSTLGYERAVRSSGIQFALIYNGAGSDASNESWLSHAQKNFEGYELAGGAPDMVTIQSWDRYPDHLLPETDSTALTHLIDVYERQRTHFATSSATQGAYSGALLDAAGGAVASAPVSLVGTPVSGAGVIGNYTLTGAVPAGATSAILAIRGNTECGGCSGTPAVTLYSASLTQGTTTQSLTSDRSNWGSFGTVSPVATSDGPNGATGLYWNATSTAQTIGVNSASLSASSGASYALTFTARISPASVNGGYLAVIFLGRSGELARYEIPFAPLIETLGSATTDNGGNFVINYMPPDSSIQTRLSFPGNGAYFPSSLAPP